MRRTGGGPRHLRVDVYLRAGVTGRLSCSRYTSGRSAEWRCYVPPAGIGLGDLGFPLADRIWTRAHVWLAVASVLVVLLGSGIAVSRIADRGGNPPVAAGGPSAESQGAPGSVSGPVSTSGA